MRLLIDKNILLDVLLARKPFLKDSAEILKMTEKKDVEGFITANSIVDTIYIMRKYISDKNIRENAVQTIVNILHIVSPDKKDILKAFELNFSDYEDALQAQCALKINANYIITRDEKGFVKSAIPFQSPEEFLRKKKKW